MALDGKVALVTGAAQGLGKAFSEILLKNGAKVSLLDINMAAGQATKVAFDGTYSADNTIFLPCDVTSETQLQDAFSKTIEKFGKLDILCNNAGIMNETNWENTININLIAVIKATYLGLKYMNQKTGGQGGVIINVSSMAGITPLIFGPVYTATKHGVVGFTRATADAFRFLDYGIRVNALCPGFVDTPLLYSIKGGLMGYYQDLHEVAQKFMQKIGILEPSVVAEGFLQLVMDETKSGAMMTVTKANGIVYHQYHDSTA
ncbi:15-hydroxyprostaglandin dehydrogenase [NAD(+)]-like [Latimeria chalumnae]|uniref:15-hydroxyprostaglandin dehydrogenase [NAD(+)] n=1 Tax=Latimeria chalumnae TaxID=7897 RepID=H3BH95_LATCH|nr:PREDICTED: 15-hydroxyprostaglandin dehydrogenase [NAD(+)]-like [Latimeria chalumnae]|eukprot:XP_005988376.1 PREDICTED: 15-hydroxyprostaglandin dehydrogenase [NAD(+)]-like [Latimeria chalumnae]